MRWFDVEINGRFSFISGGWKKKRNPQQPINTKWLNVRFGLILVSFRARFSVGVNGVGHGHGHVRNKRNSFRKQYNNVYNWAIDWKRIDDTISLSLTLFLYENLDIDPHHIDSLLMDFSLFHLLWVLGFLCVWFSYHLC